MIILYKRPSSVLQTKCCETQIRHIPRSSSSPNHAKTKFCWLPSSRLALSLTPSPPASNFQALRFPSLLHNGSLRNKTAKAAWNLITAATDSLCWINHCHQVSDEREMGTQMLWKPTQDSTPMHTQSFDSCQENTVKRSHRTPSGWKIKMEASLDWILRSPLPVTAKDEVTQQPTCSFLSFVQRGCFLATDVHKWVSKETGKPNL